MPYPALYELMPESQPGEITEETTRSTFMDTFDRASAEWVLEALRTSTAPMTVVQLRPLGGAMARVPVEATAFAHRQRKFMAVVGAVLYESAAERPAVRSSEIAGTALTAPGFACALRSALSRYID